MKKRGTKTAQAWGIDLAVAFIIFAFGILIFFIYAANKPLEIKDSLESMQTQGESIADSLLSPGFPDNWDSLNVARIGIISENEVNETKLGRFYNLSVGDYNRSRSIFNTRYDYYVSFPENISVFGIEVEGIGKKPKQEKNLIRITRFSIYKNKPATIYFDLWE